MSPILQVVIPLFSGVGGLASVAVWHWLGRVHRGVVRIEAQTQNNGGSSMRDAIDRLEAAVDRIERRQKTRWKKINVRVTALEIKEHDA